MITLNSVLQGQDEENEAVFYLRCAPRRQGSFTRARLNNELLNREP